MWPSPEVRRLWEREQAPALLALLEGLEEGQRFMPVSANRRFQTVALCELVLEKSWQARFDDVAAARHWATVGLALAQELDPDSYGAAEVGDLQARALAYEANARRIQGRYQGVEEALHTAWQRASDPSLKAHILRCQSALAMCQQRLEAALVLRERLVEHYRQTGDAHLLGTAVADKGAVCWELERYRDAAVLLFQGLEMMEPERDRRTYVTHRFNLSFCLNELGRVREAAHEVSEVKPLARELDDALTLARCDWLEGRMAVAEHQVSMAVRSLRRALDAFLAQDMGLDAAEVAMELALCHYQEKNVCALREWAVQALGLLGVKGTPLQVVGAVLIVIKCVELDGQDEDILGRVLEYVRLVRKDPKAPPMTMYEVVLGSPRFSQPAPRRRAQGAEAG